MKNFHKKSRDVLSRAQAYESWLSHCRVQCSCISPRKISPAISPWYTSILIHLHGLFNQCRMHLAGAAGKCYYTLPKDTTRITQNSSITAFLDGRGCPGLRASVRVPTTPRPSCPSRMTRAWSHPARLVPLPPLFPLVCPPLCASPSAPPPAALPYPGYHLRL